MIRMHHMGWLNDPKVHRARKDNNVGQGMMDPGPMGNTGKAMMRRFLYRNAFHSRSINATSWHTLATRARKDRSSRYAKNRRKA